jgi:hypothetical protein
MSVAWQIHGGAEDCIGPGALESSRGAVITLAMTQTPPDRLSNDPKSPFHDAALLERGIGIRFKGAEKTNVEEYCVSEGWVRVAVGKTVDRRGRPLTMKLQGDVEPYFRDLQPDAAETAGTSET